MNAVSKAAQRRRQVRTLLVLVVLFSITLGTHGCVSFFPKEIMCDDISITLAPGTCAPFLTPPCLEDFNAGFRTFFQITQAPENRYSVIGDEEVGFQFCAAADAPDRFETVQYMITRGNLFGRAAFDVTVNSLDVTVSDSPDPVSVGSDLTYMITLTNIRSTSISGLTFVDSLPATVTFVSGLAAGCDLQDRTITCRDIGIAAGASVTYQFVVSPTTTGTITNTVSLPGRLPITTTTTVNPAGADLVVTIADSPDPVALGGQLTYDIIVHNNGPFEATDGVRLIDNLPPELNFISVMSSQASCSYSDLSRNVTCEIDTLQVGRDVEIALITEVSFPPLEAETKNAASISLKFSPDAVNYDPNPDNNTATATTTVILPSSADLAVTKTDSPDPVIRGNSVTYTITVTNNGPSAATGVKLTDSLPPLEIDSSTIVVSQGSFTMTRRPNAIICDFGTLASGASARLTFSGFTGTTGTITNTATVTANEADPNTSNNTATVNTTVNPP